MNSLYGDLGLYTLLKAFDVALGPGHDIVIQ